MTHSVSEMKAIKRERARGLEFVPDLTVDSGDPWEPAGYWRLKPLPSAGPHAPNKNESRLLRSICSRTGLTEEQVRMHRTYRQQLAKAAKPGTGGRHPDYRDTVRVRRAVTSQTGLNPHQPGFFEAFTKAWDEHRSHVRRRRAPYVLLSARQALEVSLRKR
jgi:hypothetical protein